MYIALAYESARRMTFLFLSQCSSEIDAINQIMEKLKGVVPLKDPRAVASPAASTPKPKAAKLSAAEAKELSYVLSSKGSQALPSGTFYKDYNLAFLCLHTLHYSF